MCYQWLFDVEGHRSRRHFIVEIEGHMVHYIGRYIDCATRWTTVRGSRSSRGKIFLQVHFRGGNCAREQSQCSATDCSSLLDLSM
jgi:hypothetical protein